MDQTTMNNVAQSFVQHYYGLLDKIEHRPGLVAVYRDTTAMMFEGNQFIGVQAIMEKLMALPSNMARVYSSVDVLPLDGYLLVNVMGQQRTDQENDHALGFNDTFVLTQEGDQIVIVKEIFRIVLHDV